MDIQRPKSKQPIPEDAKCVFKGVMFDVYQWEQEMFDGTKKTFEKLKRPDTVAVFPVLDNGDILLLEQEQPGRKSYIGTPGGRVDEGEDILTAAKRELLEESGYEAEEFILWDSQHPVSKIDWVVYTFIAKGLRKVAEPNLDAGEKMKPLPVNLDGLIEMSVNKNFSEREVVINFLEAKYEPEKYKELKELFKPLGE
jgi:8-oxo-dGTP pyrophosphatase MutT (NUDIX family)